MKRKTKRNIKIALLVIVGLLTLGALTSFVTNLVTKEENEIHPTFEVGGLDANGKYVECKDTLFTPDAIEYNELSIELDFKSDMKYRLYFYDENDAFVSTRDIGDAKYVETTEQAKYVRVVLHPTFDEEVKAEDRKITALQKIKFVKQVTICCKVNVLDSNLMKFTLSTGYDDGSYNFEEGMTWAEFVESEYNISAFTITEDQKISIGVGIKLTDVVASDVIENGRTYNGSSNS